LTAIGRQQRNPNSISAIVNQPTDLIYNINSSLLLLLPPLTNQIIALNTNNFVLWIENGQTLCNQNEEEDNGWKPINWSIAVVTVGTRTDWLIRKRAAAPKQLTNVGQC